MHAMWRGIFGAWLSAMGTIVSAASLPLILDASYEEPTRRYQHAVLGDDIEWGTLRLRVEYCADCAASDIRDVTIKLPDHRVFEDTEPRLADLDGDGRPSVIVVESDARKGARLAIYNVEGFEVGTPFIGTRNRWLAPIGIADLDGNGSVEVAYIDRPHLTKTLRVWTYTSGALREVATQTGLTNHRIGERDIAGGIRTCAGVPEMIVASANWSQLIAVTFQNGSLKSENIGTHEGRNSFARAMICG